MARVKNKRSAVQGEVPCPWLCFKWEGILGRRDQVPQAEVDGLDDGRAAWIRNHKPRLARQVGLLPKLKRTPRVPPCA
jgi:hypothetical protein